MSKIMFSVSMISIVCFNQFVSIVSFISIWILHLVSVVYTFGLNGFYLSFKCIVNFNFNHF